MELGAHTDPMYIHSRVLTEYILCSSERRTAATMDHGSWHVVERIRRPDRRPPTADMPSGDAVDAQGYTCVSTYLLTYIIHTATDKSGQGDILGLSASPWVG